MTATKQNAPSAATPPATAYERCCAATSAAGMKKSEPSSAPISTSSEYVTINWRSRNSDGAITGCCARRSTRTNSAKAAIAIASSIHAYGALTRPSI